ncbi:MBL fold metallo-hydrolase [Hydrogenophaga sp.]|uniref:MBL fold metallo-hydrolase n=1 Tax=Hydrogenophaga sp. TaxID=1904254 RepID=UPI003F6CA3CB
MNHSTAFNSDRLALAGVTVFERGWLSANNILIQGNGPITLVDTGYWTHAEQTLGLVGSALGERALDLLLNTHLHSDHCGGNAALQHRYPNAKTWIPPGQASSVAHWDPVALTYEPTGQHCPQFNHEGLLTPGKSIRLGSLDWEIHGAKGHDPHAIVLFQPEQRILISADALWGNGFGVVFPELEGISAFEEVSETLDLIEQLNPLLVIPGHGSIFWDVQDAIQRARNKLEYFVKNPTKHHRHALKVLIKYKLLEWQSIEREELLEWSFRSAYLRTAMPFDGADREVGTTWMQTLINELEQGKALTQEGTLIRNC